MRSRQSIPLYSNKQQAALPLSKRSTTARSLKRNKPFALRRQAHTTPKAATQKPQKRFLQFTPQMRALLKQNAPRKRATSPTNLARSNKKKTQKKMAAADTTLDHSWPIDRRAQHYLSSPFGNRNDPFTGKPAFHAGIDIAAQEGTAVLASAAGMVESVGTHPRLGKYVKVTHAGQFLQPLWPPQNPARKSRAKSA